MAEATDPPVHLIVVDNVVVNAVVGGSRPDGDPSEWLLASDHPGVWIGTKRGEDGAWAMPEANQDHTV